MYRLLKKSQILREMKRVLFSFFKDKPYPNNNAIVIHGQGVEGNWLPEFLTRKLHLIGKKRILSVYSVNSYPEILRYNHSRYNIFYTIENIHVQYGQWSLFQDILQKEPSLSLELGFDYRQDTRYMRFPYWLMAHFSPTTTREDIRSFIEKYKYTEKHARKKFCAFICRIDYYGDRTLMADWVEQVDKISYPSMFRHNDDDLQKLYNDDKEAYLQDFRFNLCPENNNVSGYVTEKIFDAICAGCIPIYWGNEGTPEPTILNKDAIIYIDKEHPEKAIQLIKELNSSPVKYDEFISRPRFVPGAEDEIYRFFELLEERIHGFVPLKYFQK